MPSERILVIGGTGAQGFAVVKALLEAKEPYTVRVLSRNPDSELVHRTFKSYPQVEFAKGSFMDFASVEKALEDCYGVYVNTDGFTVNEPDELWAGVRIFEVANTIPTLRHFVYSSVDYYLQLTNFNPKYAAHHTNGKGRVHTYLQGMPSPAHPSSQLAWTVLVTGVYDEDLVGGPLVPHIAADGTRVFRLALADGHLPLMTLKDCGAFALAIFQDRDAWSGKTLNAVSHFATGQEIAETLSRVAGVKARYEPIPTEEWVNTLPYRNVPVASMYPDGITARQNFSMWWPGFQDSVLLKLGTRDLAELKRIHPDLQSLEDWMVETGWDGSAKPVLKGFIDGGITAEAQQLKI
ncbi:NmrA family protein [Coleophoma cylindrospora]|uniref:NmrA family protein n=1 Tax=Coleophoma cylindrospora TaxID=1849047 RepID=A0A3D8Q4M8_9HELO|nr:NmrA family protein [Coleophoma cylindrospora]